MSKQATRFTFTRLWPFLLGGRYHYHPEAAENGADIEARNITGMTPLMRAAEFGHTDTVLLLLQHGANINARDMSGFTALRVAASPAGHADTVALLLRMGANPNVVDMATHRQ